MHNYSDFATEKLFKGSKIKIQDILEKEIEILDFRIFNSKKKEGTKCLQLSIKFNGENKVLFTGSNVLRKQCERFSSQFPFKSTIIKIDEYYTFS